MLYLLSVLAKDEEKVPNESMYDSERTLSQNSDKNYLLLNIGIYPFLEIIYD